MLCAGHVGWAHLHQLNDLKSKKVFTKAFKDKKKKYPAITYVVCCCAQGKHRMGCGCLTDDLLECTNPADLVGRLVLLAAEARNGKGENYTRHQTTISNLLAGGQWIHLDLHQSFRTG